MEISFLSKQTGPNLPLLCIHNINGTMESQVSLHPRTYSFIYGYSMLQLPNGNFLLNTANDQMHAQLIEFDLNCATVRQFQYLVLRRGSAFNVTDEFGRIALINVNKGTDVIDAEFGIFSSCA